MVKTKKLVKKKFFEVEAPLTSAKIHLYGTEAAEFNGKFVKLDLTRNLRGKSFELRMKVKNDNGKLTAEPVSLQLIGSYVRRMIRNGIDYVEDSFFVNAKDFRVSVKPFLITRHKVSRAVRKALRDLTKKTVESYIRARTSNELFSEIISNKIQKVLSLRLKKIYPLALCEIRVFELAGERTKEAEPVEEVKEEVAEEVKAE